jgi:CRISPR system Cascade subunit CasE
MFLSRIVLSGQDSRALHAQADAYLMHQLVYAGFPDREAGGPGRVLFRVDGDRSGRAPEVLVQSEREPDWSGLLAESVLQAADHKAVRLHLAAGHRLRFRLRANPTVRRVFSPPAPEGQPKKSGTRVGVYGEDPQRAWLARKAEQHGFRVLDSRVTDRGLQVARKAKGSSPLQHLCVDFDGTLEVTDSDRFLAVLYSGIGSAKAFGFGLLSVAPL